MLDISEQRKLFEKTYGFGKSVTSPLNLIHACCPHRANLCEPRPSVDAPLGLGLPSVQAWGLGRRSWEAEEAARAMSSGGEQIEYLGNWKDFCGWTRQGGEVVRIEAARRAGPRFPEPC